MDARFKALWGVELALRYLSEAVGKASGDPGPGAVGEDIWDACQALMALRAYDRPE
jgi:hypothetical protein